MARRSRENVKQKYDEYGMMECPVCGKMFLYNPHSIYKIRKRNNLNYCGYNCYRKAGGGFDKEKNSMVYW